MDRLQDKIRGSLIGGAIGDALGYPVEFKQYAQIVNKYGKSGITRFKLNDRGIAEISDDTQMTLFTANGLLFGHSRGAMRGIMGDPASYIKDSYLEWLQTQTGDIDYTKWHYNWIREVNELHSRRAPGTTCLQSLMEIANNKDVENHSKGCGGIMRISPIPLFYNGKMKKFFGNPKQTMRVAGDVAEITHKHPMGYLPAALLAHLIECLLATDNPTSYQIAQYLHEGIRLLREVYPELTNEIDRLQYLVEKAGRRAVSCLPDVEAIKQLGEGWVAEETLAIAVCCVMRYPNDFEKAVIAAVNHSGDSDSTGAVTGNIMGAICGYEAIPDYYKENLELRWLIEEMADDLAGGIPVGEYIDCYDTPEIRRWMSRYVDVISRDQVPIKNSYWVDRDINLYAGEYPGDKNNEMCKMKVGDVTVWGNYEYFIDLTEEGELNPYARYLNKDQCYQRFPIPDCGVPKDTQSVRRLLDEIIHLGKQGKFGRGKIYLHCWGGVGRTGMIVACYYAYRMKDEGLSAEELYEKAKQQLRESFHRCPKSKYRDIPDTQEQCLFVKKFIENECMK